MNYKFMKGHRGGNVDFDFKDSRIPQLLIFDLRKNRK